MIKRTHAGLAGTRPIDTEQPPRELPQVQIADTINQEVADILIPSPAVVPMAIVKKKKKKIKNKAWVNIPVDKLPSRGLSYPTGTRIKYRPYDYMEISTLSESKMTEDDSLLFMMKGIVTRGIEKLSITFGDFLYLLLLRKLSTLGTQNFKVSFKHEGEKVSHIASSADFEFVDLEVPRLPINAEVFNRQVSFMPITIGQHLELINDYPNLGKKKYELYAMAKQTDLPFKRALKLIKNSSSDDYTIIKNIELMLYHNIKELSVPIKVKQLNLDYNPENPNSREYIEVVKEVVTVGIDDPAVMVSPFRGTDTTGGDRIYFGDKRDNRPT